MASIRSHNCSFSQHIARNNTLVYNTLATWTFRQQASHLQQKMEIRTTNCRSCLEALDQGIPADTSTKTKTTQAHSTSESWPNSLDPQRFHTERSLANWKNLSYRRQRHTAATSVRSQDKNRNFHNSSNSPGTNRSRRTPSPRRRRLRRR